MDRGISLLHSLSSNGAESWSRTQVLGQFKRYVYPIISTIAENSAIAEFTSEQKVNPFLEVLKRPNPNESQFQYLEKHFMYMNLSGENFWYVVKRQLSGRPKEMYQLRPDLVDIAYDIVDGNKQVIGYTYATDGGVVTYEPDEIVHFKLPNPIDPYRGYSPILASKMYIQTEEYSSRWTRSNMANAGRPSGVLNLKGALTKDQFEKLKKQFKREYSGVDNAGKTLLLKADQGMEYERLSTELDGATMKEIKDMSRDNIMLMFRMSKTLLGISDDVNRANAKEAKEVFLNNVIRPQLDRFVDHVNAFVIQMFNAQSINYVELISEDPSERLEVHKSAVDVWMTVNEVRREYGLPDIKGGDVLRGKQPQIQPTAPTNNPKSIDNKPVLKEVVPDRTMFEMLQRTGDVYEEKLKPIISEQFALQLKEILNNNPTKSIKHKVITEWLFDIEASKKRWQVALMPIISEIFLEGERLGSEFGDIDALLELDSILSEKISQRVGIISQGIDDITTEQIRATLTEGVLEGESITQLRARVRDIYKAIQESRVELIARTEANSALNAGNLHSYERNPRIKYKRWYAEDNGCAFCKQLHGKMVGVNTPFVPKGSTLTEGDDVFRAEYTDIIHPPLHPQCRCELLPALDITAGLEMDGISRNKEILEKVRAKEKALELEAIAFQKQQIEFNKKLEELEQLL